MLKRLADAERDGDRIYAVIKGVGGSSDGRALGLTAPRPEGQARAPRRAPTRSAGVSPAEVGLVEAHGTGTVVGDRTELDDPAPRCSARRAPQHGGCALGSVKSQIGHTKCAAGLAGLDQGRAGAPPRGAAADPRRHARPTRRWTSGRSPFFVNTEARPWAARGDGAPRRAAVSAFGFGGTNFHAVLEATR